MPHLHLIEPPAHTTAPHLSEDEVHAMQRAFVKLGVLWDITDDQAAVLMGDISVRTYRRWKVGDLGRAGVDTAARLSNLNRKSAVARWTLVAKCRAAACNFP